MNDADLYKMIFKSDETIHDKIRRAEKTALAIDKIKLKIARLEKLADVHTEYGIAQSKAFHECLMLIDDEMREYTS